MRLQTLGWIAFLLLAGCSQQPEAGLGERIVTLPGGKRIVAEVMIRPEDMARGMMYRERMEPDRGMLFLHERPGRYPYWMHNVKIPLDIVWLDGSRRVVEISSNTPPCLERAESCKAYGGREVSAAVLELAGGEAAKLGIAEGAVLQF